MIVAIIQARMNSYRLPGKVLADVGGRSMLARVVDRAARAEYVDGIVVATTDQGIDDVIVAECRLLGVRSFRGSENDVLDRYYRAALDVGRHTVVRITADCPLADPKVIDRVVEGFLVHTVDYASNVSPRTYPRGLDTEVMTFTALERAWMYACAPQEREHVTPFMYTHPEWFRTLSVTNETDESDLRWTVDEQADLDMVRALYARFDNRDDFLWKDALNVARANPKLAAMNADIPQKAAPERQTA